MKINKKKEVTIFCFEATEAEARIIRDALRADVERKRADTEEAMIRVLDMELTYDGREELTLFREAVDEAERVMREGK